jgi:peptidoglycan/LPS O-acetylase OafA/YrhL
MIDSSQPLSKRSPGIVSSARHSQGILSYRKKSRDVLGIELGRGFAIFAVILDHTGDETWGIPITQNAVALRSLLHFAVPFFLATAFYFMTSNIVTRSSSFWRSRMKRILFPYVLWSCIFLISRIIIFTLSKKPERLKELLDDPLSIVFFGGASYHLHFLPMLITGTLLMLSVKFLKKINTKTFDLIIYALVSIVIYHILESSGNSFELGRNVAFSSLLNVWHIDPKDQPLLRMILVEISWILRCLPYFFTALILNKNLKNINGIAGQKSLIIGSLTLFLLINALGDFIARDIKEPISAYLLLLFCIFSSSYFKSNTMSILVKSIGICSYGIYLIHPFVINIVKLFLSKIAPDITASVSMNSILILSIWSFLISWIVVAVVNKKMISKYLFGSF